MSLHGYHHGINFAACKQKMSLTTNKSIVTMTLILWPSGVDALTVISITRPHISYEAFRAVICLTTGLVDC